MPRPLSVAALFFSLLTLRLAPTFTAGTFVEGIANFVPLTALFLCAAVYLPSRIGVILAFGIFIFTDIALNLYHGFAPITPYTAISLIALGAIFLASQKLRPRIIRRRLPALLGLTLAASLLFFIATNTGSWLFDSAYPKSFAGWLQCVIVGRPEFPPTITFYRNAAIADLCFSALFYFSYSTWRIAPALANNATRSREPEEVESLPANH
ncbi:MAG: DUF6580 family putative transport protein [Verrucomicrobiales bacterium]